MGRGQADYVIQVEPWSLDALHDLQPAMAADRLHGTDGLQASVESAAATLFAIYGPGGARAGSCVLRLDNFYKGRELVVVALGGSDGHPQILAPLNPALDRIAIALDCDAVRFHTRLTSLGRLMRRYGYAEAERVYRKWIGTNGWRQQ